MGAGASLVQEKFWLQPTIETPVMKPSPSYRASLIYVLRALDGDQSLSGVAVAAAG